MPERAAAEGPVWQEIPIAALFTAPIDALALAVSPDGDAVALLYRRDGDFALAIVDAWRDAPARFLPIPSGRPGGLAWSPDGAILAFVAPPPHDPQVVTLYVVPLAGGPPRDLLAGHTLHAHLPCWSPDSGALVVAAYRPPSQATQPPHLFVVDVMRGDVQQCTVGDSPEAAVFTPQFAPNGGAVAFRRQGAIWLLDLATGAERRLTPSGRARLNRGCFSPDGRRLVFTDGTTDRRQVRIIDVASGVVRPLTPEGVPAAGGAWSPSGHGVACVEDERFVRVRSPEGAVLREFSLHGVPIRASDIAAVSPCWSRTGVLALLDGDGNIWTAAPDEPPRQVTYFPSLPPPIHQPAWVTYPGYGGAAVPAMLFRPAGSPTGAVVWVHGGPQGGPDDPRSPYFQALVAAGFVVLAPDYRGSSGHGEERERLSADEVGVADLADVVAGADFLVAQGLAGPGRIGLAGYSHGGYLTLLALARHPDRWAAGACLWGVLDAERHPPLRATFAQRDAAWLAARNPLAQLDRIGAPVLLLHGAQDTVATVEEVEAVAATLRRRGVPCDLHVFADDAHGLNRHIAEGSRLVADFFRRHVA